MLERRVDTRRLPIWAQARWICAAATLLAGLLGGCASLPAEVPRPYSEAHRDVADSALARLAETSLADMGKRTLPAEQGAASGLRLLPGGDDAFDARVALMRTAERGIDAQYYVVAEDRSGRQFLRELRDAAGRGVRVRLLVDDLNAGTTKGLLAELASHRNVELRMFNPLPVRTGTMRSRVLLSLHQLAQVNRRMHNKLLVADNSFAITGGRNIADEYFGRSKPANFIDMDVLVAGAAVQELSRVFDAYWNSPLAYPLQSLVDAPASIGQRLDGHEALSMARDGIGAQLAGPLVDLHPARVRVIADDAVFAQPDNEPVIAAREGSVMRANLDLLRSARDEVLVVSPYLVPMPSMLDAFGAASATGARISVVTNSLATTDEPLAHFGYARYRKTIVGMGISLYELMPTSDARSHRDNGNAQHGSLARLHAKLAVVDGRWFYVGSMNMDRRSAHSNTELGLVVESTALAKELAHLIRREQLEVSYSVRQRPDSGAIEWTVEGGGRELRATSDPVVGWGQRLGWAVLSSLIDEDYL